MYPVIEKGGKDFIYQSCTDIKGRFGKMKGILTFKNDKGENFQIEVGEFSLAMRKG